MTKKLMALFLILILVSIIGCTAPKGTGTMPAPTEDAVVADDIDEVTAIEDDLDTSSMDSLDQDLADISW